MSYYEKIFPKDVELFIVCASKFDRKKYKLKRTKITEFPDKKFIVPFRLRKFCKDNKIGAVVSLTGMAEIALALFLATFFTKTKSINYLHGNPKINLRNCFFLFSQFFTDRFLSSGKKVREIMRKFLFLSKKKIFCLLVPINVHIFRPKNKKQLRSKFGFNDKDKILIYVGRIEFEQGSDYLLELIQKNQDKKFVLIGELKDENFKNKKFKNVTHIPHILNKKLPDYYNLSDLSLFFSKRNSHPLPPRESLACGTPVILFDLDTFETLTTKSVKKVPFNLEKIQKEIDKFFLLPRIERDKLSREGRNFIINDSSEEKLKDETLKYLLEI